MPTVYVATELHEYNEKEHKDILQVVPKYEFDELENTFKINSLEHIRVVELYNKLKEKCDKMTQALEFFATAHLYEKESFVTSSPVCEAGKLPENITVNKNPILHLGLKKAREALND